MDIQTGLKLLLERQDLAGEQMQQIMQAIMIGECTPAQIAGFLIALRMKGETVDEIAAAADVMRQLSNRVEVNSTHLVDTCGTGGDATNTFNISTTVAFVAAGAGARVAKHGNRSVSSKSGSADVLEAAGIRLNLTPDQVADCIETVGIGFMFAPLHHSAMKHAIGPRKELGVRTIFNLLGPLTNPAGAPNQVLGVFSNEWLEKIAHVLQQLGSHHVLVVHSRDGMDEISISAPTDVCELIDGKIVSYTISPDQFDLPLHDISTIEVNGINDSLQTILSVLDNQPGPARDIVILNSAAAIYTAGICDTIGSGITLAIKSIEDGAARAKLDLLVKHSNSF
ncbi:MAG: anthranilate phosphoribosyltransferase [Gammaproteobacteria bacterium]|nr:anthranilate phosphoribosyltransferase [Gammaproteobacteria bacterium]NIN62756.1 anthranilate phosphoribosyltransferase [Gammaproteobacteria bacterium]NIO63737.1 anthranilate phosphoribosyltransferase [Gammaproteobacteria bacterium]NIP50115.1 anthranilate phosphoribosyltransferase [Gammaproteobacteria bacterium]NIQ12333.1 anthranilate phosphoribosyltransferase [Gammaproteobacteria bacterium]